jgi:antitoxin component of MazEF toxin-antitoxin module
MDINIVKIGNSQGIRIPQSILKQVGLEKNARLEVRDGKIILMPRNELSKRELTLLSEKSLAKLWNDPREDEAWKSL